MWLTIGETIFKISSVDLEITYLKTHKFYLLIILVYVKKVTEWFLSKTKNLRKLDDYS